MIGRVVEIAEDGRFLSADRGFMTVSAEGREIGRVPLDDIAVLLVNAHGVTYTNSLIRELAQRAAAVVLCGPNHLPFAWLWPLAGHHAQAARMRAQIDAGKPLCKRLWQVLVQAKIEQQGAALAALGRPAGGFRLLAREVRSGDPDNVEAQAARRYWPLMFGDDFRRDRNKPGLNAVLNYGYTVLRSATARAVVAAGLHPSIGVHHRNRADDMVLVDDLMEPFRPLVDIVVSRLAEQGQPEITPEVKRELAAVITFDMRTQAGTTPLAACLERLASSLGRAFETGEPKLELPLSPLPLELPALE
jgi:CRISPR-associated protein Cas1